MTLRILPLLAAFLVAGYLQAEEPVSDLEPQASPTLTTDVEPDKHPETPPAGYLVYGASVLATSYRFTHWIGADERDTGNSTAADQVTQDIFGFQTDFVAAYRLRFPWEFRITAPLRFSTMSARFMDSRGTEIKNYVSQYHRNASIMGVGDGTLKASFPVVKNKSYRAWISAGVNLPLGPTDPAPATYREQKKPFPHTLLGTGTWDPLIDTQIDYLLKAATLSFFLRLRLPFTRNAYGLLPSTSYTLGWAADAGFVGEQLRFFGAIQLYYETVARYVSEIVENSGRMELTPSFGAEWTETDYQLGLSLKIPLTIQAQGQTLATPFFLTFAFTYFPEGKPAEKSGAAIRETRYF